MAAKLVVLIGFVAAALGLVTQQRWWPTVAVLVAAISIVTIAPWGATWPTLRMIGALLVDEAVNKLLSCFHRGDSSLFTASRYDAPLQGRCPRCRRLQVDAVLLAGGVIEQSGAVDALPPAPAQ